jgi:spore coat protein JB
MQDHVSNDAMECTMKQGSLPSCAPLAAAFIPMQQNDPPKYAEAEALIRGTLFPGLDLPFMNQVNQTNPYAGTPLGELMALDFVIKELNLYLDTHADDKEVFRMLQEVIRLAAEGQKRYAEQYGPISLGDLAQADTYTWLKDPWPWEYRERTGK